MSDWNDCAIRIVDHQNGRFDVFFQNSRDRIFDRWVIIHDASDSLVHIVRSLIPAVGRPFNTDNGHARFSNQWHIFEA